MDETGKHHCRVDPTIKRAFYPKYRAVCDQCGPVGPPEIDSRDALAIARRHEEIDGFEKGWTTPQRKGV